MTYSRALELSRQCLQAIGLNAAEFGLHSFRAGGATAAAQAGVSDRLLKRHGGWKSDRAKDSYIVESQESLLAPSQALGLSK